MTGNVKMKKSVFLIVGCGFLILSTTAVAGIIDMILYPALQATPRILYYTHNWPSVPLVSPKQSLTISSILPGMTRKELGKIYPIDGGLQSYVNVRYLIPEQSNMKVVVSFAVKRNPHDQNRIQPTDEDKVISVSPAYYEVPFCD
jgi:hypothetical protein